MIIGRIRLQRYVLSRRRRAPECVQNTLRDEMLVLMLYDLFRRMILLKAQVLDLLLGCHSLEAKLVKRLYFSS